MDPEIEIRSLRSHDDYAACVQLQRDTWGATFSDAVPPSILKVSQMVGGVSAGAFAADGRMVGFVFGLTGVRDGRIVHWSDMLAVRPEYRDRGVGRQLKEFQRDIVRALGAHTMFWTFEPLVARNAHLNLNRLGASVCEYVMDMYGADTGSTLHTFGTDRFVVAWPLDEPQRRTPADTPDEWRSAPLARGGAEDARILRVEIPADVIALPTNEARAWRERTRPAFTGLMTRGYRVAGFITDADAKCFYVLSRDGDTTC